jgi:hypothetical protein
MYLSLFSLERRRGLEHTGLYWRHVLFESSYCCATNIDFSTLPLSRWLFRATVVSKVGVRYWPFCYVYGRPQNLDLGQRLTSTTRIFVFFLQFETNRGQHPRMGQDRFLSHSLQFIVTCVFPVTSIIFFFWLLLLINCNIYVRNNCNFFTNS